MFAFLRQNHNYIIRVNVIIVSWKLYKLLVDTSCSSIRNIHDKNIASLDQIGRNLYNFISNYERAERAEIFAFLLQII